MASAGKGKEIDAVQVEPITSETSKEVFLVLSLPTAEEKRLVPQICNRLKAQGCKVTLIADPGLNYLDVALLGSRLEVEVLEIPLSPAQPGSDLSTLIAQGLKSILLSRSQDPVLKLPDLAVIGSGMEAAVEIFSEFGIETLSMLVTQVILTSAASFLAVGPQTLDPEIIRSASTYQDGGVSRNLDLIGNSDPQHTVVKEDELFQWLDSQPAAQVVYVRFGANIYNDKWADALEASDVRFVWNVGPPSEYDLEANESNLPFGLGKKFGDRVRFISGPAPEASFLSHRSIGLLVTQCDFGTVYEGLKCGVPILVLSCKDDQFCASEKMLKYSGAGMVLPYFTKKDDMVKGIECVLKNKGMKKRAAALALAFWGVHCLIGALLKTSLPGKRIKALAFKMFK